MNTNETAPPAATEQPAPQAQDITEQAPQTTPANQQETAPQAISAEEIAALRAQAAKSAQLEESYKQLHGEFTRKSQILSAITGHEAQQPKTDPLEPYVKKLVSEGYHEKDARAIASVSYDMIQPIMDQQRQQQAAFQSTNQVGYVMQDAYAKYGSVFTPEVINQVQTALHNEAMKGNHIDAEYALDLAFVAAGRRSMTNQNPAVQPQQPRPQFANGMFGINNPFNAAQPQTPQNQIPPHLRALQQETQAYIKNNITRQ